MIKNKTIALLPVKNEEWILPTYLKNVVPVVDEIIAIDDNSTDKSKKILEDAGALVLTNDNQPEAGWNEFNIRQKLLDIGRQEGGKYFITLDADETFTSNFIPLFNKAIKQLQPGQRISLQWLCLWKTTTHYRDDNSVWSNNFKDFIFCDDGISNYIKHDKNSVGVERTPNSNKQDSWIKLNPKYGAVLHYQFSNWRNFQLKQAWYRMSELLLQGKQNYSSINQKYSITLDSENVFLRECPKNWIEGLPNIDLNNIPLSWHYDKINKWFHEYGAEYFKDLNIWHISEIINLIKKDNQ